MTKLFRKAILLVIKTNEKMISEIKNAGLTSARANELLVSYGLNVIKSKKKNHEALKIFLSQLKSPLVYVLTGALIITLLLADYTDSLVILAVIVVNTLLGYYQERKAQNSMQALENLLSPKAIVVRDGREVLIDASLIVPNDLVVLTPEYNVPADGQIIKSFGLSINEANLTGESDSIMKARLDKAYMGTRVTSGKGYMIVEKTGSQTEIGKIGRELNDIGESVTPLEEQIRKIARNLSYVALISVIVIFTLGIIFGYNPLEIFITSVAVAVAAIPEGLIVSMTVVLAIGMQKILKHKAVVRKLISAETLGSVSIICCDKTGTLTEGDLKVKASSLIDKNLAIELIKEGMSLIDPLEVALLGWAEWNSASNTKNSYDFNKINEVAFDSDKKVSMCLLETNIDKLGKSHILFTYGAPEMIFKRCVNDEDRLEKEQSDLNVAAHEGDRMIALAYKFIDQADAKLEHEDYDMKYLGYVCFEDPIRKDVKKALSDCLRAHVRVKVITGDHSETAFAVLKKVGLIASDLEFNDESSQELIMHGEELDRISEEELSERIDRIILFARTTPTQKLKIVNALQKRGEVVAMTGDGVNDAPALKAADIGIVVGEASDVSKEVADIVLLDSNFKTIVKSIEEGRTIFENIRKVLLYLLSDSFTELVLIMFSIVARIPLPVTAAQILWINLIEDSLPSIALAFEKTEKDILQDSPRSRKDPILNRRSKIMLASMTIISNIFICGIYIVLLEKSNLSFATIQTIIFVALATYSLMYVYTVKSLRKPIYKIKPFDNKYLNLAVVGGMIMVVFAVYLPILQNLLGTVSLSLSNWMAILSLGILSLFIIEVVKYIVNSKQDKLNIS